jgi:hypothetical protein
VTLTVQLLSAVVETLIVICNCVLLMKVTSLEDRVFPPPVHVTDTVGLLTKFAPLIVIVCWFAEPVTGFGLTPLSCGAGVLTGATTVTFAPPDCGPGAPVCTRKPFCTTKL